MKLYYFILFFIGYYYTKDEINLEQNLSNEPIFFTPCQSKNYNSDKKNWTILVYIAADCIPLFEYALNNIRQMMDLGSSSSLNIIVHFNYNIPGRSKVVKRYYVMKDKLLQIDNNDIIGDSDDNPDSLITMFLNG